MSGTFGPVTFFLSLWNLSLGLRRLSVPLSCGAHSQSGNELQPCHMCAIWGPSCTEVASPRRPQAELGERTRQLAYGLWGGTLASPLRIHQSPARENRCGGASVCPARCLALFSRAPNLFFAGCGGISPLCRHAVYPDVGKREERLTVYVRRGAGEGSSTHTDLLVPRELRCMMV